MAPQVESIVLRDASVVYAQGVLAAFNEAALDAARIANKTADGNWRSAFNALQKCLQARLEGARSLEARAVMGELLRAGGRDDR